MTLTLTKEMVIGEVVENYPAVAEILAESGLGCMDCSASGEETILQGFMSHGLTESDVENLLAEINKKISAMEKSGEFKTKTNEKKEITITDTAVEKAKELMKKQKLNGEHGLRIMAKPGGCAGYKYGMAFDKLENVNGDFILEKPGLKIIVDQKSLGILGSTTVDFVEDLEGSRFVFNNPDAKATCGCGKSFR